MKKTYSLFFFLKNIHHFNPQNYPAQNYYRHILKNYRNAADHDPNYRTKYIEKDCLEHIKEISEAAWGLNELVNDLLDISAINSGSFSINLEDGIDVADVINRSIRLNYAYALRRHIKIESKSDLD